MSFGILLYDSLQYSVFPNGIYIYFALQSDFVLGGSHRVDLMPMKEQ